MLDKKIFYFFLIVLLSSCSKDEMFLEIEEKVKQETLLVVQNEVDIVNLGISNEALSGTFYHFPAKIHMSSGGQEYIIHNPAAGLDRNTWTYTGPIQMKRVNNEWKFDRIYDHIKIGNSRNTHIISDNSYLLSSAPELPGGIGVPDQNYWVTMNNGVLDWKVVNHDKRWSHDISGGDLNGDGLMDVVSASPLSIYIQNKDEQSFTKRDDLYKWEQRMSAFAVEIADIIGDKTPEIITGGYYGSGDPLMKNNLAVYSFNKNSKQFEIVFDNKNPHIFFNEDLGATSIQVKDFNNDGKKDIAIAREGNFNVRALRTIEIWNNNGDGQFTYMSKIQYSNDELDFTEFICEDVNKDGYIDIILNGNKDGDLIRVKNNLGNWMKFRLNHLIQLNDGKGIFKPYDRENLDVDGAPDYLYPFMRNNKLCFFGTQTFGPISNGIRVNYWDVTTPL